MDFGTGTDRANVDQGTGNLTNLFNFGLDTGKTNESTGTSNLNNASDFFTKALTAGRTDTAAAAAPEINANLAASDAARRREATAGTSRTGGTAEINRQADAATAGRTDDIINKTRVGTQEDAAKGLTGIGSTELSNAMSALGIGGNAQEGAIDSNFKLLQNDQQQQAAFGKAIGNIFTSAAGLFF